MNFKSVMNWCQGRHTAFALYFAICGTVLEAFHRLDPSYVALVTAIQGLILAHSYKEDKFNGNGNDNTTSK